MRDATWNLITPLNSDGDQVLAILEGIASAEECSNLFSLSCCLIPKLKWGAPEEFNISSGDLNWLVGVYNWKLETTASGKKEGLFALTFTLVDCDEGIYEKKKEEEYGNELENWMD